MEYVKFYIKDFSPSNLLHAQKMNFLPNQGDTICIDFEYRRDYTVVRRLWVDTAVGNAWAILVKEL